MNSCGNVVVQKYSLPRAEHMADNVGLRSRMAAIRVSPSVVGGERQETGLEGNASNSA